MNSKARYQVSWDSIANMVGRYGWKVIDTHDFDKIIAHCDEKDLAQFVADALNVNDRPTEYGLKLVTGEDENE